jgi:hypothetical protein
MKSLNLILALGALATSAYAQLYPLPPSTPLQPEGVNAGVIHWDDPGKIAAYKVIATSSGNASLLSATYNPLGLTFSSTAPGAIWSDLAAINSGGGSIKAIVVSSSAGWLDSFGYSLNGIPTDASSTTLAAHVNSGNVNTWFGSSATINLAAGEAPNFDFWLSGPGVMGADVPAPTADGGVYTVFHQTNSTPPIAPYNAWIAQMPIMLNTWVPALGAYSDVATYLVGMEDWRLDHGADRDYSDFVFALQFYDATGTPFSPVPEPSTYALGACALLGLMMGARLWKQRRAKS